MRVYIFNTCSSSVAIVKSTIYDSFITRFCLRYLFTLYSSLRWKFSSESVRAEYATSWWHCASMLSSVTTVAVGCIVCAVLGSLKPGSTATSWIASTRRQLRMVVPNMRQCGKESGRHDQRRRRAAGGGTADARKHPTLVRIPVSAVKFCYTHNIRHALFIFGRHITILTVAKRV